MPLKWWNAQTCTKCHRTLCNHHAAIARYSQKSVLQAVCKCCNEQATNIPAMPVVSSLPKEYITV